MEEILHHLRCKKNPLNNWMNYSTYQVVQDFFHQQYLLSIGVLGMFWGSKFLSRSLDVYGFFQLLPNIRPPDPVGVWRNISACMVSLRQLHLVEVATMLLIHHQCPDELLVYHGFVLYILQLTRFPMLSTFLLHSPSKLTTTKHTILFSILIESTYQATKKGDDDQNISSFNIEIDRSIWHELFSPTCSLRKHFPLTAAAIHYEAFHEILQGGPLPVISGLITPIHGLVSG